jgi:hypothetical protein
MVEHLRLEQAAQSLYEVSTGNSDWRELPPDTRVIFREVSRRFLAAYNRGTDPRIADAPAFPGKAPAEVA